MVLVIKERFQEYLKSICFLFCILLYIVNPSFFPHPFPLLFRFLYPNFTLFSSVQSLSRV